MCVCGRFCCYFGVVFIAKVIAGQGGRGAHAAVKRLGLYPRRESKGWHFAIPLSSEKSKFPIRKQFSHRSMIIVPFIIHISLLPKKRNCPHHSS